jgi:hypothetical protein
MIKRIKRRLSQSFSKDQNVEDTFSELTIEDRGAKVNGSSKNFLRHFLRTCNIDELISYTVVVYIYLYLYLYMYMPFTFILIILYMYYMYKEVTFLYCTYVIKNVLSCMHTINYATNR